MDKKILVLKTDQDVKMVFDPFRKKIVIAYLDSDKSLTAKQVGELLDESPAKVNYHIKKLVNYGTLVLDKTENINGIIAKYYKSVYKNILFRGEDLSNEVYLAQTPWIEESFKKLTDKFIKDLHKHMELVASSENNDQRHLRGLTQHLYMTKDEQEDFLKKFDKLVEPYLKKNEAKEVLSMLHTMARIK